MTTNNFPKSVLAVGAHPDDIDILGGGTLALYASRGVKVSMAVATDGSAGHMVIKPDDLAVIRHKEAENAARVIGADFYWVGVRDEYLTYDMETRLLFCELIRKAKPDVIITHDPQDYHPDHRMVSQLMFAASFMSGLKHIETESPYHPGVQPLIYFDSVNGAGSFQPTEYVDISEVWETKRKMLSQYESQITWLRDHDNVDFFEMVEISSKSRGYQCGVKYAEAFRCETVWPRPRPYRMLP